jgi:hypothetical protein
VISLLRLAKIKIMSNAKVNNEILKRGEKVPGSGFYSGLSVVKRMSPPAQRGFHAIRTYWTGPDGSGLGQEDIAFGLRECLHSSLRALDTQYGKLHRFRMTRMKYG